MDTIIIELFALYLYMYPSNGFFSAAIVLLEKNADPNSRDKDGLVPLHWACHGKYVIT